VVASSVFGVDDRLRLCIGSEISANCRDNDIQLKENDTLCEKQQIQYQCQSSLGGASCFVANDVLNVIRNHNYHLSFATNHNLFVLIQFLST
jgi:hypothetical protein